MFILEQTSCIFRDEGLIARFPIGALLQKSLNIVGGIVNLQKYWKELFGSIESGKLDLSWAITHKMPLEKAAEAYRIFDRKEEKVIKIVLQTGQPLTAE